MAKLVIVSVFILVSSHFVKVSEGGPVAYKQHRDTGLEELRSIDSYVSGALPVLQDGFFIGTSNGPVLVKSEPLPGANKRPTVRAKYYNTLPRLIPDGFEGVATSHFNLGPASPIRPYSLSKNLVGFQEVASSQPQQFFARHAAQRSQQYLAQAQAQPAVDQPQQFYFPQAQSQQYLNEAQQPQQYLNEAQQPQQYLTDIQQPQQFVAEAQQSQQYASQSQQYQLPEQQFLQPEEVQSEQGLPQHYLVGRQAHSPQERQQQYLAGRQLISPQEAQQYQQIQQQQQFSPEQDIRENYQNLVQQESPQIEARSQSFQNFGRFANSQDAEQSFQVDNLLTPEDPPQQARTFQRQLFGTERFQNQNIQRNQNAEVVAASEMEETLPEPLKNRFYKSANLAEILAQESLPVQGEQIVGDWDTHKIAKGKIHALLEGAGLI